MGRQSATSSFGRLRTEGDRYEEETGLHFCGILFSVLAFQGNCHSQCQQLRQELIKDCRNDLGPNSEHGRVSGDLSRRIFTGAVEPRLQGNRTKVR